MDSKCKITDILITAGKFKHRGITENCMKTEAEIGVIVPPMQAKDCQNHEKLGRSLRENMGQPAP